jgi:hypothetical protein
VVNTAEKPNKVEEVEEVEEVEPAFLHHINLNDLRNILTKNA